MGAIVMVLAGWFGGWRLALFLAVCLAGLDWLVTAVAASNSPAEGFAAALLPAVLAGGIWAAVGLAAAGVRHLIGARARRAAPSPE